MQIISLVLTSVKFGTNTRSKLMITIGDTLFTTRESRFFFRLKIYFKLQYPFPFHIIKQILSYTIYNQDIYLIIFVFQCAQTSPLLQWIDFNSQSLSPSCTYIKEHIQSFPTFDNNTGFLFFIAFITTS